jgi:SAM-dependent methyltransferase
MRALGWDVQGVEPDPRAAVLARDAYKLPVLIGTLQEARLPEASFDAITMSHVIEHVPDPWLLLKECCRLLKEDGRLVLLTPNIRSLGHRLFRRSWLNLDPPRHLQLFSIKTLRRAARQTGLVIKTLRTTSRASRNFFVYSADICRHGRTSFDHYPNAGRLLRFGSWVFWALEDALRQVLPGAGEELLLVAGRPAARPVSP